MTVTINNGSAAITDACCPDKLCVHMGSVSKNGQWAACLPSKVMITVTGGKKRKEEVDTLAH